MCPVLFCNHASEEVRAGFFTYISYSVVQRLAKITYMYNYLLKRKKSVIFTAYKTHTSGFEVMKNWPDHARIMIVFLVLTKCKMNRHIFSKKKIE